MIVAETVKIDKMTHLPSALKNPEGGILAEQNLNFFRSRLMNNPDMKKFLGQSVDPDVTSELDRYIREGGFPKTLEYENPDDKKTCIHSVLSEIFEKDIRRRMKIRNAASFEQEQRYIINNFGSTTSLGNILENMHKSGSDISRERLNSYIQILIDAKILHKCERFDMKSRRSIGGEQKYYLTDLGFYFSFNTDNRINYGPVFENILYLYVRSNGYAASVGRIGKLECDFILRRQNQQYSYVQVGMTIMNGVETENREYSPLESVKDNYPKYVVT